MSSSRDHSIAGVHIVRCFSAPLKFFTGFEAAMSDFPPCIACGTNMQSHRKLMHEHCHVHGEGDAFMSIDVFVTV